MKQNPSFIYFTIPNFCDINDFMFQYQYSNFKSELIESILNHEFDEIINKLNLLPNINAVVNKLYNKYNLKIGRNEEMNKKIKLDEKLIEKFNDNIPKIKEYFKVDFPYIINEITNLSELINLKENKIYKIYESFNTTIEKFNKLLNNYKQEDHIQLETNNIQDFKMADSFINYSDNSNTKNLAFNRLLELIRIYSTRNRFKDGKLNVYGGDKIIYDFQSIEKILFNEFIFGRKLLINSQRVFIFSNEVFANERNDLINQIIKKFKINNDEIIISEMELKKDIDEMYDGEIRELYYDFQNILIYIYYFYIKDKNKEINEKITLKEICEKLEENGYIFLKIYYQKI